MYIKMTENKNKIKRLLRFIGHVHVIRLFLVHFIINLGQY